MSKALKKGDIVVLVHSYLHDNSWSTMPENYIYEIDRDSNDYSIEGRITKDVTGFSGGWVIAENNRKNRLPEVRLATITEAFAYKLVDKPIKTGTDEYLQNIIKEEIKRLYPIGTIVNPIYNDGSTREENYTIKYDNFFVNSYSTWEQTDEGTETHSGCLAYYNNLTNTLHRAKVVSKPEEKPTTDFKEGDWVIGWHTKCNDWRDKPWQVGKTEYIGRSENLTIRPLYHTDMEYGTHDVNVKKLTKEEVLEWVKKEYPLDCKYKPLEGYELYHSPNKNIADYHITHDDKIDIGVGYVYLQGKWAEKQVQETVVETPKPDTTNEVLVFGQYPIGSHVVSLSEVGDARKTGDVFKILDKSSKYNLYYREYTCNNNKDVWRAATIEESAEYERKGCSYNISELNQSHRGLKPDTAIIDEVTNSTPKFKVGDVVVVTEEQFGCSAKLGYIGTIYRKDDSSIPYCLNSIKDKSNNPIGDDGWCVDVRHATESEKFVYGNVAVIDPVRTWFDRVAPLEGTPYKLHIDYSTTPKQAYDPKDYIMSKYVKESPEDLLGL